MNVVLDKKKKELVIRLPLLEEAETAKSGKFLIVARTDRFEQSELLINGKVVAVSACAGISAR